MTDQFAANFQDQISSLVKARELLLTSEANNTRAINKKIIKISSAIKSIIEQIVISQCIIEKSQKIINAIQKMCARIIPNYLIIEKCYPEEDFNLSDFREILAMCKSDKQRLFVLYCYVISYACKFAEHQPWVANYIKNNKKPYNEAAIIVKNFANGWKYKSCFITKYIPRNASLMIEKLLHMYKSEFISFHQNRLEFSDLSEPIDTNSNCEEISDYVQFFIDFRHALRFSDPECQCLPLCIDHCNSYIYPSNIIYGTSQYTKKEEKVIQAFLLENI